MDKQEMFRMILKRLLYVEGRSFFLLICGYQLSICDNAGHAPQPPHQRRVCRAGLAPGFRSSLDFTALPGIGFSLLDPIIDGQPVPLETLFIPPT